MCPRCRRARLPRSRACFSSTRIVKSGRPPVSPRASIASGPHFAQGSARAFSWGSARAAMRQTPAPSQGRRAAGPQALPTGYPRAERPLQAPRRPLPQASAAERPPAGLPWGCLGVSQDRRIAGSQDRRIAGAQELRSSARAPARLVDQSVPHCCALVRGRKKKKPPRLLRPRECPRSLCCRRACPSEQLPLRRSPPSTARRP